MSLVQNLHNTQQDAPEHYQFFLSWLKQTEGPLLPDDLKDYPAEHLIELYPEVYKYGPYHYVWLSSLKKLMTHLKTRSPSSELVKDLFELTTDWSTIADRETGFYKHPQQSYRYYCYLSETNTEITAVQDALSQHVAARQVYARLQSEKFFNPEVQQRTWSQLVDDYNVMCLNQDVLKEIPEYAHHHMKLMNFQKKWRLI